MTLNSDVVEDVIHDLKDKGASWTTGCPGYCPQGAAGLAGLEKADDERRRLPCAGALAELTAARRLQAAGISISTVTGAWSLGRSSLRCALSMVQARTPARSGSLTRMWSMRSPWFLRNARLR